MKTLGEKDVMLLSAGQIITGVVSALKELIENALDSGAKNVKIQLVDSGLVSLSVTDDGSGITPDGRALCAERYTTSKIQSITDLKEDLTTFGFRGEALNSLCVQSDVTIITRCRNENMAEKLTFNHEGNVVQSERIVSNYGTTVTASNMLSCYPVRRLSEKSRVTKPILQNLLQKYFLAAPQVRFTLESDPLVSLSKAPCATLTQAVIQEFGTKVASNLSEKKAETYVGDIRIRLHGLVPTQASDWQIASTTAKQANQVIILNGRPVSNVEISDYIDTFYRSHFGSIPKRYTVFVLMIDFYKDANLTSSAFDINTDAAKSKAIFAQEKNLLESIGQLLNFEEKIHTTFSRIKEWPSTSISFEKEPFDVSMLGGLKWMCSGRIGEKTMFSVLDPTLGVHLVSIDVNELFQTIGVQRAEIERGNIAELVPMYWDQIMEASLEREWIKHIGIASS